MTNILKPEVYDLSLKYFPHGCLLDRVAEFIVGKAPKNGRILDLMCGTGCLLGKIKEKRKDLISVGVDIDTEYINFAKSRYDGIEFIIGDVLQWQTPHKSDFVICTGGIHHIPYEKQAPFLHTIPSMLKPDGIFIYGDSFIDDYDNERERRAAAVKLGYAYFKETKKRGAPNVILDATRDILCNDVNGLEFKISLNMAREIVGEIFNEIQVLKIWPKEYAPYGDCIIIAKEPKNS